MSEYINLQDAILKECAQTKVPVTIFLMNGFQTRAVVLGHDSFVIAIESEGKKQMVYKHAVSTVVPAKQLKALTPTGMQID